MAAERQTLEEQFREARGQRDEPSSAYAERQAIDQQRRELQASATRA